MTTLIIFLIYIVVSSLLMVYLIYRAPEMDDNGNIKKEDDNKHWDENKQHTEGQI